MASKTGEDMVIDAKKLCLTFDANDGPVHAPVSYTHLTLPTN